MVMAKNRFSFGCACAPQKRDNEKAVQPGLALTPSQINKMTKKGIPVTSQNLEGMYFDGEVRPSWEVPLDQQRGVDIATMWQKRQDIKSRWQKAGKDAMNVKDE